MVRAFLCAALAAAAVAGEAPYIARPAVETGAPYGWLEHAPPAVAGAPAARPLVLFLHGYGEQGDSATALDLVARHGPIRLYVEHDANAATLDAAGVVVVAPQALKADDWWRTEKVVATLDAAVRRFHPDPDRIYVTGLSMGGGGTWDLAAAIGGRLAAIAPVCGKARPAADPAGLRGLPVWAWHAIDDPTVKVPETTGPILAALLADAGVAVPGGPLAGFQRTGKPWTAALRRDGWRWAEGAAADPAAIAPARLLTLYPDGDHDSWTRTYANPAFWDWLLAQRRRPGR